MPACQTEEASVPLTLVAVAITSSPFFAAERTVTVQVEGTLPALMVTRVAAVLAMFTTVGFVGANAPCGSLDTALPSIVATTSFGWLGGKITGVAVGGAPGSAPALAAPPGRTAARRSRCYTAMAASRAPGGGRAPQHHR